LSVTIKTAEQIDMQFGMWTRVSSRNRLDGVQICTREGAILWREGSGRPARHIRHVGGRYTRSDSIGGSTSMVRMPIGVY